MRNHTDQKQVSPDTARKMEDAGYAVFVRERDVWADYFVWVADFEKWEADQ